VRETKKCVRTNANSEPILQVTPTVSRLLAELTEAHRQQLVAFAQRRVRRLVITPWTQRLLAITSPEDIVAETYRKILSGERCPLEGRVLPAKSLLSTEAFIRALEGIIRSEISNWVKLAEGTFPHEPVDEANPDCKGMRLADPADSPGSVGRRDLQQALFTRLRQRALAEPELVPVIEYWAPRFLEADRIATSEFDQNLVCRVRQRARRILWELAAEAEPHALDGRGMLL
jgi:hypothetical protein